MKDYLFSAESIEEIAQGIFKLVLTCDGKDEKLQESCGGQFIHLKVPDSKLILRRPFCIYSQTDNKITVCFAAVGAGTVALSKIKKGDKISGLMPLGNGFNTEGKKHIALLGGGMGCAALFNVTEKNPNIKFTAFFGYSSAAKAAFIADFNRTCKSINIFSDDGSIGVKGYPVTGLLEHISKGADFDTIFICGPHSMMIGAKKALEGVNLDIQASMEERMGCGIGACLVCTCKVEDNGIKNKRVCKDGPIFNLNDLIL